MDLIQMYHDQESQSSSSCEGPTLDRIESIVKVNASRPKVPLTSFHQQRPQQQQQQPQPQPQQQSQQQEIGTNGRQLHRHADKLDKNQQTNFAQWMTDIDKRVHLCLGSLNALHKNTILESMDYFISKLTKDYDKLIKPKIAEHLSNYIRTYLYVYRYLYRSYEMGKRYFKRIIKILAIYTDMELCASIRGIEYDAAIAERVQFIYETHLQVSDQSMVLDVFLNIKRVWRRHRGILNILLQYFLIQTKPVEFADLLFIKNLIVFKRWLYIEEVDEDRDKIREAFAKFVKPKKTICMNSLFKPYLPVDDEGFVRIENMSGVLDTDYSVALLTRVMRRAEESTESQAKEILIVLTDDEDEPATDRVNSNNHHSNIDDFSNDFDCHSSISTHSTHTSNEIMLIDTLSIDTVHSQRTMSRQSIDLVTDNTTSMSEIGNTVDDISDNSASANRALFVPSDIMSLNSSNEIANTSNVPMVDDGNGCTPAANDIIAILCHGLDTDQNNVNEIPPLDQSTFNNLVNNINATHISESFGNAAFNISANESATTTNKPPSPVVTRHEMSCQTTISLPIHGDSKTVSEMPRTSTDVAAILAGDSNANEPVTCVNGLFVAHRVSTAPIETHCDTMNTSISNVSLATHQETLLNIDEILSADLNTCEKGIEQPPSDPMPMNKNASTETTEPIVDNRLINEVHARTPIANNSINETETELLSKSEQELLYDNDKDAFLMDIFPSPNDSTREGTSKRSISSPSIDDRPPLWLRNGINNPPKTYSKIRNEKANASKQFADATPKWIEDHANVTPRAVDDEDSFLMDLFCSNEVRSRLQEITPISKTETVYSSSTPKMRTTHCAGNQAATLNRRTARVSKKANGMPNEIKSPAQVPSPRKTTKRSDSMTTKKNIKRVTKSQKQTEQSTKNRPNRTNMMDTSRFAMPPTILTRQTYIKPLIHQSPGDCDNSFIECTEKPHKNSKMLASSFGRRPNGKCSMNADKNTSATILERKTYIKTSTPMLSNTSSSVQLQPFDSCSHNTSGSSTNNSCNLANASSTSYAVKNDNTRFGSVVSNDSNELDYLENLFSSNFDSSKGIRNPNPAMNSSRTADHLQASTLAQKRLKLSSDDYSDLDDSTGYNTRKSKRSRKRPKKLDL